MSAKVAPEPAMAEPVLTQVMEVTDAKQPQGVLALGDMEYVLARGMQRDS